MREGCPSSPPLFNACHIVVMSDFRRRRKRKAEETGLTPGLDWTTKVDGKLRRPHQEMRVKQKGRIQHQDRQIIGDVEFADDTALFANIEKAQDAENALKEAMSDWDVKLNTGMTEKIIVVPGGRPEMEIRMETEKKEARHIGGWIEENGGHAKETTKRIVAAQLRVGQVARAWSLGEKEAEASKAN